MLITNPAEFAHVAREWAIKYAGAPEGDPGSETTGAEGSGGVTEETLKKKDDQKRERAEAAKLAQYAAVFMLYTRETRLTRAAGITDTTSFSWIASPPWALTFQLSLPPLSSLALTRTTARTTSSRRSTWATLLQDFSARRDLHF